MEHHYQAFVINPTFSST